MWIKRYEVHNGSTEEGNLPEGWRTVAGEYDLIYRYEEWKGYSVATFKDEELAKKVANLLNKGN